MYNKLTAEGASVACFLPCTAKQKPCLGLSVQCQCVSVCVFMLTCPPYQPDKDAEQLDDVSVRHSVEAAKQGVEDGDEGRHYDGRV